MNFSIAIIGIKAICALSLLFFLNNFRWFLIGLRLRKKFNQNIDNPNKNIRIENDVTELFNKANVNMVDRRNGLLVSKELHSHRYCDLQPLFDKAISYFFYNMRHPFRWLLFTERLFRGFPPIVTYITSILLWFIGYIVALYLDTSGYGQIILSRFLSLLPI